MPEGKDFPVFYRKKMVGTAPESRFTWQNLAAAVGFKRDSEEVLVDQNLIADEHGKGF